MKKYRFLSLITAAALTLSCTSCTLRSKKSSESSSEAEESSQGSSSVHTHKKAKGAAESDLTPDGQQVHDDIEQLFADMKISDNEDAVSEDIQILSDELDLLSDASAYLTLEYYENWNDEDIEAEYDEASEAFYIALYSIIFAFYRGYANDEYSFLFEDYVDRADEDTLEYYTSSWNSLRRVEGYSKVDYELMDEDLDRYYEIAYDDDLSDDEKNLQCAELYLEIISRYDTETYYDMYNRDYTPDEILSLSENIRDYLLPVYDDLLDSLYDVKGFRKMVNSPVEFDDPLEVILEYAPELSDDVEKYAQKAIDDELYTLAYGDECYDGSFTVDLPSQNSALMYIYCDNTLYALPTAIHEFGHFYASFFDETPAIQEITNLDVAEVQSQGMELMFMQFYDELYGEQADAMKLYRVIDMLDSVVTGFFVGEFEYKVLRDRESLTPQDVVDYFDEIMADYDDSYNFYYIPHLFEQPGYYISYGTSALAALDLLGDCTEGNYDDAFERYDAIAHVSSYSSDTTFKAALDECGFSDVLSKKYIKGLSDTLYDFADSITG